MDISNLVALLIGSPVAVAIVWGLIKNHFSLKALKTTVAANAVVVAANTVEANQKRDQLSGEMKQLHTALKENLEKHEMYDDKRFTEMTAELRVMNNSLIKQNTLLELLVHDKIKKGEERDN